MKLFFLFLWDFLSKECYIYDCFPLHITAYSSVILPCNTCFIDFICLLVDNCYFAFAEIASRTIQSHVRGLVVRRKFVKMVNAVTLLQTVFRAWLKVRQESVCLISNAVQVNDFSCGTQLTSLSQTYFGTMYLLLIGMSRLLNHTDMSKQSETYERYTMLFVHRQSFLKLKRSAQLIQQAVRNWLHWRHQQECSISPDHMMLDMVTAATTVQKFVRGWIARSRYIHQVDQNEKAMNIAQQKLIFDLQTSAAVSIQLAWKNFLCCKCTKKQQFCATKIQCNFRRWFLRKRFLNQIQAVIKIQSYFRRWRCLNDFQHIKRVSKAAIVIQSYLRGWIVRKDSCARRNHIVEIQVRDWLAFFCL